MVYDVPRNYVGDTHFASTGSGEGGGEGEYVREGDELTLDAGVLVEVQEAVGEMETDLTGLVRRRGAGAGAGASSGAVDGNRKRDGGDARLTGVNEGPNTVQTSNGISSNRAIVGAGGGRTNIQRTQHPQGTSSHVPAQAQAQAKRKHKPLNSLLETPRGPPGRAVLPVQSPYEIRRSQEEKAISAREPKRQRVEDQRSKENVYDDLGQHRGVASLPPVVTALNTSYMPQAEQQRRRNEKRGKILAERQTDNIPASRPSKDQTRRLRESATATENAVVSPRQRHPYSPPTTVPPRSEVNAPIVIDDDDNQPKKRVGKELRPQTLRLAGPKPRRMLLSERVDSEAREVSHAGNNDTIDGADGKKDRNAVLKTVEQADDIPLSHKVAATGTSDTSRDAKSANRSKKDVDPAPMHHDGRSAKPNTRINTKSNPPSSPSTPPKENSTTAKQHPSPNSLNPKANNSHEKKSTTLKATSALHRPFKRIRSITTNNTNSANSNNHTNNTSSKLSSVAPKGRSIHHTDTATTHTTTKNKKSSIDIPEKSHVHTAQEPEARWRAEEKGPWSVEALDLFDWRPPNWEERVAACR